MEDIIIIGAGPSGIMAGISAATLKKKVTILEKNPSIGKKILVSGNGKCNLTNSNLDLTKYHGNKEFLKKVFRQFNNKDLISFFNDLMVELKEERFGRIIPVTEQAITLLDALVDELNLLNVKVNCNEEVLLITNQRKAEPNFIHAKNADNFNRDSKKGKNFTVKTNKACYEAKNIILAVGGCSYPQLGSTKKGYELARSFGHSIIEPRPALVPLELDGNWFHKLQGVKTGVIITIKNKKRVYSYSGEILFTKYGISGPVVLDASKTILDFYKEKETELWINFIRETGFPIEFYLEEKWKVRPNKSIASLLSGIINKKIAYNLLPIFKVDPKKNYNELSTNERKRIIENLLHWLIKVKGSRPFTESIVTTGGVSTDEVNPESMESKLIKGLYFAGEILNIDGESGGFNMQFAFSSGWIAGKTLHQLCWHMA